MGLEALEEDFGGAKAQRRRMPEKPPRKGGLPRAPLPAGSPTRAACQHQLESVKEPTRARESWG